MQLRLRLVKGVTTKSIKPRSDLGQQGPLGGGGG